MKVGGGSGTFMNYTSRKGVEKSRERRSVEYSTIGCKVIDVFIIIFGMSRREGV
jgi:hypothetical protein